MACQFPNRITLARDTFERLCVFCIPCFSTGRLPSASHFQDWLVFHGKATSIFYFACGDLLLLTPKEVGKKRRRHRNAAFMMSVQLESGVS